MRPYGIATPRWAVGQAAPAPAPVPGRALLREALALLFGAGLTERAIHQEVDAAARSLQETDPPFRSRFGDWHFDGTHWTLAAPHAASGAAFLSPRGTLKRPTDFAADALRDLLTLEQLQLHGWRAVSGSNSRGDVEVFVDDEPAAAFVAEYLRRRVGPSIHGFPIVVVQIGEMLGTWPRTPL